MLVWLECHFLISEMLRQLETSSSEPVYQPAKRYAHSKALVGDYLYVWGGDQPGLSADDEEKLMRSVMEVCHVPTGRWEQKPTTGNPPLGVYGCATAVIKNEIFFFGGWNYRDDCFYNSLYSFNVDTLNWKELSPTASHRHGPMMKSSCGMIALQMNGEDYLAVIGGRGSYSNPQPGAQYSNSRCNEVHLYKLKTGEWTSPTVTGDRPPPIVEFTFTSITNTTAILFGGNFDDGSSDGYSNDVYIFEFTDTSVKCSWSFNPGGWPRERGDHSSVLINCSSGPHLLVVGGYPARDCCMLNVNKMEWKELFNLPDSVAKRHNHSLSVWSETPTTIWIIVFGGKRGFSTVNDTSFIKIISSPGDLVVQSALDIDEYQKRRIQEGKN